MKALIIIFGLLALTLPGFRPVFAQAPPTPVVVRADLSTRVGPTPNSPQEVVVDVSTHFQSQPRPGSFWWYSSEFVLDFDTASLQADSIKMLIQGRWSKRFDPTNYDSTTVTRGVTGNSLIIRIRRKIDSTAQGPGRALTSSPGSDNRIVRFAIPFKGCKTFSSLKWRATWPAARGVVIRGTGYYNTRSSVQFPFTYFITTPDVNGFVKVPKDTLTSRALPDGVHYRFKTSSLAVGYKLEVYNLAKDTLLATYNWKFSDSLISGRAFVDTLFAGTRDSFRDGCSSARLITFGYCGNDTSNFTGGCPPPCPSHTIQPKVEASADSGDLSFCVGTPVRVYFDNLAQTLDSLHFAKFSFDGGLTFGYDSSHTFTNIPSAGRYDTTIIVIGKDRYGCKSNVATLTYRYRKLINTATRPHIAALDPFYCFGRVIKLTYARLSGEDSINYSWFKSGTNSFVDANGQPLPNDTRANPVYYRTTSADIGKLTFGVRYACYNLADSVNTIINPFPSAEFSFKNPRPYSKTNIIVTDTVTFTNTHGATNGACTYFWNFGDGTSITTRADVVKHAYANAGNYLVQTTVVKDDGGCRDSTANKVNVENLEKIFIPTAFAPTASTNDNNKVARVYGVGISSSGFSFAVFSRWGEKVYEASDFDTANKTGWNGKKNNIGEEMPLGSYTFAVKGKYTDGTSFEKTGNITLIR